MKPHHFCLSLVIIGILLTSSPPVSAGLDQHLPEDTIACASWAGRGMVFDGSMFGQMIQDPDVQELLSIVYGMIDENIPASEVEGKKIFKSAWEMGVIAWECPAAVGVSGGEDLGITILIDLGKKKTDFKKQFDEILAIGKENPPPVAVGEYQYQSLPDVGFFEEASYGFKDDVFFVTLGKNQAKALLQRDPLKSLAADKKYQECIKAVGGKNEQISFYIDVDKIVSLAEGKFGKAPEQGKPSQLRTIINALGVGKLKAVAGSVCIVDKGMHTKIKLFTPAPHQGLLLPFAGRALTEKDVAGIPADAAFALVMNISAEKLYNEIFRVAREIDPQSEPMMQSMVARMEETLGVTLVDGLLKTLGDTWIISSASSQGGPLTGTVISVDVKDPEALQKTLQAIEVFAGNMLNQNTGKKSPRIRKQKFGDIEITYLHAPDLQFVLPAWAIHKNRLYLATWPQVIVSTIKNQTPPLTGDQEFKRLRGHLSPDASGIIYTNIPKITKAFYPVSLIFGTALINQLSEKLPAGLPDKGPIPYWPIALSTVMKYTWAEVDTISHDATGITFEAYGSSPVSMAVAPVAGGALVMSVVLPALNDARYLAKCASSAANLKGVGMGLVLYAAENQDKYPEHLGLLVAEGDISAKMLKSPLSNNPPPRYDETTKKLTGFVDYTYIYYENPAELDSSLIAVYENPANYSNEGVVNCLFLDAHVERVPVAKFRELLKKSLDAGGVQVPQPAGTTTPKKSPARGELGMHFWDLAAKKEIVLTPEDFKGKGNDMMMGPMGMGLMMNPKTGNRTLLRMELCPSCEKWFLPDTYKDVSLNDFGENGMLIGKNGKEMDPVMMGAGQSKTCPLCGIDIIQFYRDKRKKK